MQSWPGWLQAVTLVVALSMQCCKAHVHSLYVQWATVALYMIEKQWGSLYNVLNLFLHDFSARYGEKYVSIPAVVGRLDEKALMVFTESPFTFGEL